MKAVKSSLVSTFAMLVGMASSFAQDFGIVSITPSEPDVDISWEAQLPEVIRIMMEQEVAKRIDDSKYYLIDYKRMGPHWQENSPYPIVMEDGTIVYDEAYIDSFQKLKYMAGEGTGVNIVNHLDIHSAMQAGSLGEER